MKTKISMEKQNQMSVFSHDKTELKRFENSGSLINKLLPNDYRSIQQVIQSNLPSIAKIRKQDPEVAQLVIQEFITDLVEFLNVGKIMNASQIHQTAIYIPKYFPHFNLGDLKLFFDKMKLGHYGKFYDSVDGQLILSKMEEYSQDRMNEYEQLRLAQHREEIKNNPIGEGYHPDVIAAIKKALGEKRTPIIEKIDRPKTDGEIFTQRCIKQFDNLHSKFGLKNTSGRFLKIGNEILSLPEFLERKFRN